MSCCRTYLRRFGKAPSSLSLADSLMLEGAAPRRGGRQPVGQVLSAEPGSGGPPSQRRQQWTRQPEDKLEPSLASQVILAEPGSGGPPPQRRQHLMRQPESKLEPSLASQVLFDALSLDGAGGGRWCGQRRPARQAAQQVAFGPKARGSKAKTRDSKSGVSSLHVVLRSFALPHQQVASADQLCHLAGKVGTSGGGAPSRRQSTSSSASTRLSQADTVSGSCSGDSFTTSSISGGLASTSSLTEHPLFHS